MFSFMRRHDYQSVDTAEPASEKSLPGSPTSGYAQKPRSSPRLGAFLVTALVVFALSIFTWIGIGLTRTQDRSPGCANTAIRHEWRSLSRDDQHKYLRAVQCLQAAPSRLDQPHTRYEDFSWTHNRYGNSTHQSGAFLAWHRYYIHLFEQALQQECGFEGILPYWDWSLDWEDFYGSPIWDVDHGFGGSGNESIRGVLHGYCMTEGPFANLQLSYIGELSYKHCLSRGFIHDNDTWVQSRAKRLSPDSIDELLKEDDFNTFNIGLEATAHNAIPQLVRGDFWRLTAPNDPIFYLHHGQLDRIWSRWQAFSDGRKSFIGGVTRDMDGNIMDSATIHDTLEMGGLGPPLTIADLLTTQSDILCYRY